MIQAFYTGASGLTAAQTAVNDTANNIANVNTVGYKSVRTKFKEALYQAMTNPTREGAGNNLMLGHGVLPSHMARNFSMGSQISTDSPFDFAIMEDGFFAVQNTAGEIMYTRSGAFNPEITDDGIFLINSSGNRLLDMDGNQVQIFGDPKEFQIGDDGTYQYLDPDTEEVIIGQLGVYIFPNNNGLLPLGTFEYRETADSGTAIVSANPQIRQKFLEGSNVDYVDEMSRLIRAQRGMQFSQKIVQAADEIEALANTIRS